MPTRAPRVCGKAGCNVKTTTGRCDAHAIPKDGWTTYHKRHGKESRHARGYGKQWTKLRKQILTRDKHICQCCLSRSKIVPANQVDHITPKQQGGTDDLSNLQALCEACHKIKTLSERGGGAG